MDDLDCLYCEREGCHQPQWMHFKGWGRALVDMTACQGFVYPNRIGTLDCPKLPSPETSIC